MTHQKREAGSINEDWASKRPKSAATSTEKDCNVETAAFQETDAEKSDTSEKGSNLLMDPCILDEKSTTISNVPSQQEMILTSVETDAAEDKGCRHTMEDAWVVLPCDAHISQYMMDMVAVWLRIMHRSTYTRMLLLRDYHMNVKVAKKAIIEGFRKTDESLLQESTKGNWQDGATAVCVWVLGQTFLQSILDKPFFVDMFHVVVVNVGDAKAVLARSISTDGEGAVADNKSPLKAIVLTREHKAIFPQERSRIQKAGGSVGPNGRLQGRIEVSRALGDRHFKKVGLIATPDVHSFELTMKDNFIILGCDGLWGVFGPSDAVEFVQKQLKEGCSATLAVRRLVKEAVRERQCKDNCTAVLIVFKH